MHKCANIPFKVEQYFACCLFLFYFLFSFDLFSGYSNTHTRALDLSFFRFYFGCTFIATVVTYFDNVINVSGLAENNKKKYPLILTH